MAKKKVAELQETARFELPNGGTIVKYEDGSLSLFPAPIKLTAGDVSELLGSSEGDDEEGGISLEEMKEALLESGLTKAKLKKMSDDEIEEAYGELEDDEEDDEEDEEDEEDDEEDEDEDEDEEDEEDEEDDEDEEDEEDEDDEDDEEDEEDEDEDDGLSPESLSEMDFEELEDLCDEKDLDTDPDDFDEESVEGLRKAVAKELKITLPKTTKGKKKK